MPELPEVETTRRGIAPHIIGRRIDAVVVRVPRLRFELPPRLADQLCGKRVRAVRRRAKYLLIDIADGTLLLHLGMSGSLRVLRRPHAPPGPHDHFELHCSGGCLLRLNDPRRFGAVLWLADAAAEHDCALLRSLGPEPLSAALDGDYLYRCSRGRRSAVKALLMDGRIVSGLGNIYAAEVLFAAGIDPHRASGRISARRYIVLSAAIKRVLRRAITHGGTTLRDFTAADGRPGYFRTQLAVYGRGGRPCLRCGGALRASRLGQRSTVHCPSCQR